MPREMTRRIHRGITRGTSRGMPQGMPLECFWKYLGECLREYLEDRTGLLRGDNIKCFSHEASAVYHNFVDLFNN